MDFEIKGADAVNAETVLSMCRGCAASDDPVFDEDVPTKESICGGCVSGCSIVACREGKVLGWAGLRLLDVAGKKKTASVNIFVDRESRGRGIGKALLDEIKKRSKAAGLTSITSNVYSRNVPGMMLHKKAGFKALGVVRNAGTIKGKAGDAVMLEYIV